MASLMRKTGDNLTNGVVLGLCMGILIASSDISWIQSIVTSIVNIIPIDYHFQYVDYVTFGFLGAVVGYWIDRK